MTEKKKVWPDNDSDDLNDWDFNTLKRYVVVHMVESFILGGSKGLSGDMHWMMVSILNWGEADRQRKAKEK